MSESGIFKAAVKLPPERRAAYLDQACGSDAQLRAEIESLLHAHDATGGFLEDLPAGPDPTADYRPIAERPGTVIGPYKLMEQIGEGGFGLVFVAEQQHPIRRKVALKIIKPGMDTREIIARFEAERQALALMDHAHIARVFDAGTTQSGRPYFVMELVKGIPITEYCDAHRLDLNARLALFRQVCSAVQHAHQKGIIHRDLKPSNILVESHDEKPVPKVIDFGLAKATNGLRLTEQSLYTAFGSVAGTPLYMAPEQASFNALDVDTRADIYALGAILYELLTGSTPISRGSVRRAALDEMLRVIREVEPPAPSSRISTSEALPSLAANRHVEPGRLSRLVRGDLDWIVMKALAKERERRYASAIGLADDLERFLNHEPVSAGPPTAAYRLRKFVRRNRARVTAAGLVLLALVLGVVGTTLGLIEARRQQRIADEQRHQVEKRAAQVTRMNDILGSIFQDLDPVNAARDGKPLTAVLGERLDRATAEIEGEATGDPLAVAGMQMTLGVSQLRLGYPDRAITLFTKARATYNTWRGADHPDTLMSMNNLTLGYHAAGQLDRALKLGEETLALRRAKLGPDHPHTLLSMNNLALSYADAGQHERAVPLLEEALALRKAKLGPDHPDILINMNNLANSYAGAGQHHRALKIGEETLTLMGSKLGADHPHTLTIMINLATDYADTGQHVRALKLREETLTLMRSKLGADHPHTLASMLNLASSYDAVGQHDRALKLFEETLTLMRSKLGSDHPYTLECLDSQARCLAKSGQLDRAGAILDEVSTSRRKAQGDDHPDALRSRMIRADLDLARGRLGAAEAADRAILDECRARLGADHTLTIAAGIALARVRDARGDRDSAAPLYRAALESARKNPADRDTLAAALAESGRSWLGAGDRTAAEALLREALAIGEAEKPQHWRTAEARSLLGGALLGQKRTAEAASLLRSGYEGMARAAAAIPLVDRTRLSEAVERLIAAGEAAGTKAEVAGWRAERAKLGAGAPKP